jgi:hypothetical protein
VPFLKEIADEIRMLHPGAKEYRQFAFLFFIVCALAGGTVLWHHHPFGWALLTMAGGFATVGLFFPGGLRWPYLGWMTLAVVLGFFVSRALLVLVYYGIVTAVGLGGRLAGKVFLEKIDRNRSTYWHDKSDCRYEPEDTEKMY